MAGIAGAQPAYFTNFTATVTSNLSVTVSFEVAGGSNGVPINAYRAATPVRVLWSWLGPTFSGGTYSLSNQPLSQAFFTLGPPPVTMAVAWGDDFYSQSDVPSGLSNVVAVAGGFEHSVALQSQGTVVTWGEPTSPANWVPTNLPVVLAVAAGWNHNVALLSDSTVTAWGIDGAEEGWHLTDVPAGLSNVTAIAASALHSLALRSDGTVVGWGENSFGETNAPADLTNVVAIAAGGEHNLALRNDGTVAAWGDTDSGQCAIPAGLSNVLAVAAGWEHSLALRNDGTVVAWGDNTFGQTNVPAGLTNIIAIAAGGNPFSVQSCGYSLALRSDGTVVAWGDSPVLELPVGMDGVMALGAGGCHALAVRYGRLTPVITGEPLNQYQLSGGTVNFTVLALGLDTLQYQWETNGVDIPGATNATLTLTNVGPAQQGNYLVVVNSSSGSIISSNATFTLVTPPVITWQTQPSNQFASYQGSWTLGVSATAPGQETFPISYQWQLNGTNLAGATSSNHTFLASAATAGAYSVVVGNAAGSTNASWQVQVPLPGSAFGWGENGDGESDAPALTNISAIAAGDYLSVAVEDDGTVIQWGYTLADVPADLTNAAAVAAGYEHCIALRRDGTVETWGAEDAWGNYVPTGLAGVKAIAAAWDHNVALLTNGTVTAWGFNGEMYGWGLTNVPADLTNATAISAQALHTLALRSDGTVVAWGDSSNGEDDVPAGLTNVVAVAAGGQHSLALKADGTVVAWGRADSGQCDVPAGLSNVMAITAGWAHSVALKNDGTMVSWGDNTEGQTTTPTLNGVKLIAAGGNHTLASMFSTFVQYPVDVTKDLLLICNTNSPDGVWVKDYYLAHRPMVSGANVLAIGCTNIPSIRPEDYTNTIAAPVQGWLAANPTKRPQYVILMAGIPWRVNTNPTPVGIYALDAYDTNGVPIALPVRDSVQCQLHSWCAANWQPFVTSLNMGEFSTDTNAVDAVYTNACKGYIDKLANMGTNYSAGTLLISASAVGYGNTNLVFDNVRYGYNYPGACFPGDGYIMSNAVVSLEAMGLSDIGITYTEGNEDAYLSNQPPHITNATNVAGYMSWGEHSLLGGLYAMAGGIQWQGDSGWYLIETIESYNGQVEAGWAGQGNFFKWYSINAFGGTNYSNTPVGAVTSVDEPYLPNINNSATYFGLWAVGKDFAMCAWNSYQPLPGYKHVLQVVGDPFVTR